MKKIISIVNQKGGVGKTTLAIQIAYCFKNYAPVCIIDADPQGIILSIKNRLTENGVAVKQMEKNIQFEISKLDQQFFIIDTPPYLSENLSNILIESDFSLIPTKPGSIDIIAIKPVIAMLEKIKRDKKKNLNYGVVLNMVKKNTVLAKSIENILSGYDIRLFKSIISDRVSFSESATTNGIFQTNDEKAKEEVVSLVKELLQIINIKNKH